MFADTAAAAKVVSATLDGTPVGVTNCASTSSTCNFNFPINTLPGNHTLTVTAACEGKNINETLSFSVVGALDTTPSVTILSPADGSAVDARFTTTARVLFKNRAPQYNDWGFVSAFTEWDGGGDSVMVPTICSTQDCTVSFTLGANPNGPTQLTVEAVPIIAGVYDLPTGSHTITLNSASDDDPDWKDILPTDNPRDDSGVVCPECDYASSVNVINGRVSFGITALDSGSSPLSTSFSFFYDSEDIDGSKMQNLEFPYRQPLGRGWDHSYNMSLFKNQADGTMVMRGGGTSKHFYTPNPDGSFTARTGDSSVLSKGADGTFTVLFRDGTRYKFTASGALMSIRDRFSNEVTIVDHRTDLLPTDTITITDPAGRMTTLNIDPTTGLISSVVDPADTSYGISYDPVKKQISTITLPVSPGQTSNPTWDFTYDANSIMDSKTDPNGNVTTYESNEQGKGLGASSDDGAVTRGVSYEPEKTTATGENGGKTEYIYSSDKVITGINDPAGISATFSYTDGMLTEETMPISSNSVYVWSYQYDSHGNKTDVKGHVRKITPLPSVDGPIDYHMGFTYDANNFDQVASITNFMDDPPTVTSFTYDTDAEFRRITAVSPAGGSTVTRLEANGNIHEISRADGSFSALLYDPKGQLTSVTTSGVKTSFSDYDDLGNAHTVKIYNTDGVLVQTRTYEYDRVGRVSKDIVPAAVPYVTSYGYDPNGNRNLITDANTKKTGFTYDFKNRMTKIIDALKKETDLEYLGDAKLTAVTDANNNRTTYEYDQAERLYREVPAAGDPIRYEYDIFSGRLQYKKNDRTGATLVTFIYDDQGRVKRKEFADGTWASFSYTPGGRLWTAANQDSALTFDYHPSGLLKSALDAHGAKVSYLYDPAGRRTKLTVLEGTADQHVVDYGYTAEKLTSITSSLAGVFGFGHDKMGRRETLTYPNGVIGRYAYHPDQISWLTGISYTNMISTYAVTYPTFDMVGNRTSKDDGTATIYGYDDVYRLQSATATGEGYTYDDAGNRLTGPRATDSYTIADDNRLMVAPRASYEYDAYGNLTKSGLWSYSWSLENKLTRATNGIVSVTFKYDALGRRISKKLEIYNYQRSTRYLYDGEDVAAEYVDGVLDKRYVHGADTDEHLALVTGGKSYFYHADGLGSITRITDSAKKVVQSYEYDSFGKVTASTGGLDQPYAYTGREHDRETRLYFYRARYYDPEVGRFIGKDPIGFAAGTANYYGYVDGNAVNLTDPDGLWSVGLEGYAGVGGGLAVGRNPDGSWFYSVKVGAGKGGGFQYDPDGQGPSYDKRNKGRQNVSFGLYADAGVAFGPGAVGYSAGAGVHLQSARDCIRGYGYHGPKKALDKGLRFRAGYAVGVELSGWNGRNP